MNPNTRNNKSRNSNSRQCQKGIPLSKAIRISISEEEYDTLITNTEGFRDWLDRYWQQHPELFPDEMSKGYHLHGFTRKSSKMELRFRRILVDPMGARSCYTIYPSFVMPFMRGKTDFEDKVFFSKNFILELEKMLFLSKFGTPFWALGYVFDKDPMFCYRAVTSMGRFSLVGTTIQEADNLPEDLVADEKHTSLNGNKAYIATTAAKQCILGVGVSETANETGLSQAYATYKEEANDIAPDYAPKTVNTDGWLATKKAWLSLFPYIHIIECFLHAILGIRNVATRSSITLFNEIVEKSWNVYQAETLASFSQRMRRLKEWGKQLEVGKLKDKLLKLCDKKQHFTYSYQQKSAHRTSNMVDRLMDGMDRFLYAARYFHSNSKSAETLIRAYALIYNFSPSSPQTVKKFEGRLSPAERLNDFRYHDNWLHNLLISASRNGYRSIPHNPL